MTNHAYLCIVTWPDGTEGLLFPAPGNVEITADLNRGRKDFETAIRHLKTFVEEAKRHGEGWRFAGTQIRLVKFQPIEVLAEHVHGQ